MVRPPPRARSRSPICRSLTDHRAPSPSPVRPDYEQGGDDVDELDEGSEDDDEVTEIVQPYADDAAGPSLAPPSHRS